MKKTINTRIKVDIDLAKTTLTVEEALALLKPHSGGKKKKMKIHTMENLNYFLMGCDVDFADIKRRMKEAAIGEIRVAGIGARVTGHGVAIWNKKSNNWLFLATDNFEILKVIKRRGIVY